MKKSMFTALAIALLFAATAFAKTAKTEAGAEINVRIDGEWLADKNYGGPGDTTPSEVLAQKAAFDAVDLAEEQTDESRQLAHDLALRSWVQAQISLCQGEVLLQRAATLSWSQDKSGLEVPNVKKIKNQELLVEAQAKFALAIEEAQRAIDTNQNFAADTEKSIKKGRQFGGRAKRFKAAVDKALAP